MSRGTGTRGLVRNIRGRSTSKFDTLEARRLLSTSASLAVNDHLYTVIDNTVEGHGSDLYVANADGTNQQLLNHWDFNHYAPKNLFAYGDKLLFSACTNNITQSYEPWVSDGTVAGTKIIKDLYESGYGSDPSPYHLVNGRALFTASNNTPSNIQLYSTDGTYAGTVQLSPYGSNHNYGWGTANEVVYGTSSATFSSSNSFSTAAYASIPFITDGLTAHVVTTPVPADGLVTAGVGSSAENSLSVTSDGTDLYVLNKGRATVYELSQVKSVALSGNQYSDSLSVADNITLPVTFYSNGGADTFKGGGGVNTAIFSSHQANPNPDLGVTLTLSEDGGSGHYSDGKVLKLQGVFQTILTGTGNDTIIGTARGETIHSGAGDDSIVGNGGPDELAGGNGIDTIVTADRADTIYADAEDTVITTYATGSGDDGGSGNTGGGDTTNAGSTGTTTTVASNTAHYTLSNGVLRVYGINTTNLIRLIGSGSSIKIDLNGVFTKISAANVHSIIVRGGDSFDAIRLENLAIPSKLYGLGGNDAIVGSLGKDRIYGGDGDDWISGGDNHDTIYGEAGNDTLMGDAGHDYLVGGAGVDMLRGGASVDHLIYTMADDVHANAGDKLTIESILA